MVLSSAGEVQGSRGVGGQGFRTPARRPEEVACTWCSHRHEAAAGVRGGGRWPTPGGRQGVRCHTHAGEAQGGCMHDAHRRGRRSGGAPPGQGQGGQACLTPLESGLPAWRIHSCFFCSACVHPLAPPPSPRARCSWLAHASGSGAGRAHACMHACNSVCYAGGHAGILASMGVPPCVQCSQHACMPRAVPPARCRSTARTTAGQRVALNDVQEAHEETRGGLKYWVYEHITQVTNRTGD